MTYSEVIEYMHKRWKSEMRLGLSRVKNLLHELGDPQKHQHYIHVAGTNGKGSTVSCIATILAMSGRKVGVYTSPFLERFTDRIRILDGEKTVRERLTDHSAGEISQEDIADLFTEIMLACDRMVAAGGEEASEFEVLTSAALLYFSRQNCDVVVLETGLGGRLDATNAIDFAQVTVITAMGYDHCAVLGNTMREIAVEKAAIIKPGTRQVLLYDPAWSAETEKDAEDVLEIVEARCQECAAPLTIVQHSEISDQRLAAPGQYFKLVDFEKEFLTPLLGDFQLMNAALAIRSAVAYDERLKTSPYLYEGLKMTVWPGRLELADYQPRLLMDGAHNPQAARALVRSMEKLYPEKNLVLLIGVLKDKDYLQILRELEVGLGRRVRAIVCSQPGAMRDLAAAELANAARSIWTGMDDIVIIEQVSVEKALLTASAMANKIDAIILACGSLYLITEIKHCVENLLQTKAETKDEED